MTPCTLCHQTDATVVRDTLRYDIKRKVLRCNQCSFVYLEAANANDYYETKAYRETYGPDLKKKTTTPRDVFETYLPFQGAIIDQIKGILRPDMKVLDVGCSAGQFLTALKGKVAERIGLELSSADVEFIRSQLDFKVYTDPIQSVTISEGPFDLITSLQVLEHIPEPLSFLEHISRNLKPGGYLYLELPNINDIMLIGYHIAGYENFYYREPHVSYYSEKTLRQLLDQAGFVGTIKTVQRYTFINHLHWLLTGQPQDNYTLGNTEPTLITAADTPPAIKEDFNNFIKQVNQDYLRLVEKHGLGESLTFLGQKKV